jgi:hypothetical protein
LRGDCIYLAQVRVQWLVTVKAVGKLRDLQVAGNSTSSLMALRSISLCHVTSCHVMSCHVMSCHVMSCRVVSCRVVSCRVVLCCVELCCVVLFIFIIVPHYTTPLYHGYVLLCYIILQNNYINKVLSITQQGSI